MGGVARYVREVCRRGYEAELAELGLAKLLLIDVGGGAEGEVDDAVVFCMHVRLVGGLGRGEVLNEAAGSHGEDVERVFVEREVWERGSVEALMLVLLGMLGLREVFGRKVSYPWSPFISHQPPSRAIAAKENMLEGISAGIEET